MTDPATVAGVIIAGLTFVILYSGTLVGVVVWIQRRIEENRRELQKDFDRKHLENSRIMRALEALVLRHDVLLNPEWRTSHAQYHAQKEQTYEEINGHG